MNTMNGNITEHEAELIKMAIMEHDGIVYEWRNITGDADAMEHIYAHVYQYYQEGRLDEAEQFFYFLCLYDLRNPDYFTGLGAVNQLKGKYLKACDFYALAYVMAEKNLSPVFYSGQCQLLMGNIVKALHYFEIVCQRCTDESIAGRAKIYVDIIRSSQSDSRKIDVREVLAEADRI